MHISAYGTILAVVYCGTTATQCKGYIPCQTHATLYAALPTALASTSRLAAATRTGLSTTLRATLLLAMLPPTWCSNAKRVPSCIRPSTSTVLSGHSSINGASPSGLVHSLVSLYLASVCTHICICMHTSASAFLHRYQCASVCISAHPHAHICIRGNRSASLCTERIILASHCIQLHTDRTMRSRVSSVTYKFAIRSAGSRSIPFSAEASPHPLPSKRTSLCDL